MPRALIIGGSGQIGQATAPRFLAAGWGVDVTGGDPAHMPAALTDAGATFLQVDRNDPDQLLAVLGDGIDLLVDCSCYTAAQATWALPLIHAASSTVMVSSKAVYVDPAGNHPNSDVAPRYDGPIRETQPTMEPLDIDFNSREGYGANKVAAERVFLDSGQPVTVLRPSKIHGVGARRLREWMLIKRVLDGRPAIVLAHRGAGVDHPTAAVNMAALIEAVAANPGQRILNSADPDAPSALAITRTIARHLHHDWDEILLDGPAQGGAGEHPWDPAHPIVLDMTAATELGYTPVGDYAAEDRYLAALRG